MYKPSGHTLNEYLLVDLVVDHWYQPRVCKYNNVQSLPDSEGDPDEQKC